MKPTIDCTYARLTFQASYWLHKAYQGLPPAQGYDNLPASRKALANRGRWFDGQARKARQCQLDTDLYSLIYRLWVILGMTDMAAVDILDQLG
jgi:hypothetical protein